MEINKVIPMRVFVYARVSTERQAEHDISIPDQLRQMRDYCSQNDLHIVHEYTDAGYSATTDHRPQFQAMMQHALDESHPVDGILVYAFSRLFRNLEDSFAYRQRLKCNHIVIRSLTQQTDETPMGRMVYLIFGTLDELQSAENAKHTRRAMSENAREGFFNGSRPPFGYTTQTTDRPSRSGHKKIIVKDNEEAAVVERIYDLYEHGLNGITFGMKKITMYLNEQGSLRRSKTWIANDVRLILSDPVYTGKYIYRGRSSASRKTSSTTGDPTASAELITIPVPVIIDEARFNRLAVKRHDRSPRKRPPTYVSPPSLLTGICRCGYCNCAMLIATGKSGRYRYYKCNHRITRNNAICSSPNVPASAFDRLLLETVIKTVLTEERIKVIVEDCRRNMDEIQRHENAEYQVLKQSRTQLERRLDHLYRTIEVTGIGEGSFLKNRILDFEKSLAANDARLSDLKHKVIIPDALVQDSAIPQFVATIRGLLADPSSEAAKAFIRLFVNEVRIYADEATVAGSNLGTVEALIHTHQAAPGVVPSFIPKWRAWRDSNSRPPGS